MSSKIIYESPWIKIRLDNIIRHDGKKGTYDVVQFKGGIGVVALDSDNKFYLVGQYRYAPQVYSWEIPKGAFESFGHHELPLFAAKRELKEETGIEAKSWKQLAAVHTLMGSTDDKVYLFLARSILKGKSHPEETEGIVLKKVNFEQFYRMVKAGLVTDATSIAGVLLSEKLLR